MRSVMRTGLVLTGISGVNLLASLAVQVAMAYRFGASADTDAYLVAWTVPFILMTLVAEPLGLALIPRLSAAEAREGERAARRLAGAHLALVAAAALALGAALVALRDPLVRLVAPGIGAEQHALAASLALPLVGAACLSLVATQLQYLHYHRERFVLASLVAPLASVSMIGGILLLGDRLGVNAIALGMLAGAVLQLVVLLPSLRHAERPSLAAALDLRGMAPAAAFASVSVLPLAAIPFLERNLGSGLDAGRLTHLSYSWAFAVALASLVSRGLLVSVFPALSRMAHKDDAGSRRLVQTTVETLLFVMLAGATCAAFFSGPLIQMTLARGTFGAEDATAVASILPWHAASAVGIVLVATLNRAHYSIGATARTAIAAVALLAAYLVSGVALLPLSGATGLAIANAIAWTLATLLLLASAAQRALLDARRLVARGLFAGLGAIALGSTLLLTREALDGALALFLPAAALLAIFTWIGVKFAREAWTDHPNADPEAIPR